MDQPTEDAMPSILSYAQPIAPRMPSVYYPGPAAGDLDSESASACLAQRIVLAITLAAIVILVIMIIYHLWRGSSHTSALARGLTQNGWTVYLRKGCGFCDEQMKMLGGFSQYTLYGTDGSLLSGYTKTPPLTFGVIKGFPCWYNLRSGETRMGLQNVTTLQQMAK
jgi:hypothetical protein